MLQMDNGQTIHISCLTSTVCFLQSFLGSKTEFDWRFACNLAKKKIYPINVHFFLLLVLELTLPEILTSPMKLQDSQPIAMIFSRLGKVLIDH